MVIRSRNEAEQLVQQYIEKVHKYSVISVDNARVLLGDRLSLLLSDPIRKQGPVKDYIYYYNVVDYLCNENPRKKS